MQPGDADRRGARGPRPARDPVGERLGQRPADEGGLRRARPARGRRPGVLRRLPAGGLAAGARAPRRAGLRGALRADRRRLRAVQRLQRAERPGRAAEGVRGGGAGQGRGRPRGRRRRPRLRPRPRVRHAVHGWPGHRHRPAGDAARQRRLDPRGDPVPDPAAGVPEHRGPGGGGGSGIPAVRRRDGRGRRRRRRRARPRRPPRWPSCRRPWRCHRRPPPAPVADRAGCSPR